MLKCHLKFDVDWGGVSFENKLQLWINKNKSLKALWGFTCWSILCYRNSLLFNNKVHPLDILVNKIIFSFQEHQKQPTEKSTMTIWFTSDINPCQRVFWRCCSMGCLWSLFFLACESIQFLQGMDGWRCGNKQKIRDIGFVGLTLALKL